MQGCLVTGRLLSRDRERRKDRRELREALVLALATRADQRRFIGYEPKLAPQPAIARPPIPQSQAAAAGA
jgi:hypothetical protein